jgi:MoxR-like ATPase
VDLHAQNKITYPRPKERKVLDMSLDGSVRSIKPVLQPADVKAMQDVVKMIYIDDQVKQYILNISRSTRDPANFGMKNLKPLIEYGASPRASIYLGLGARAIAFLQGRARHARRERHRPTSSGTE